MMRSCESSFDPCRQSVRPVVLHHLVPTAELSVSFRRHHQKLLGRRSMLPSSSEFRAHFAKMILVNLKLQLIPRLGIFHLRLLMLLGLLGWRRFSLLFI